MEAYPAEARTGKTMGGRRMKQGGFNTSDVNLKHQAMAHFWSLLLSHLDGSGTTEHSGRNDTVAAFLVTYFQNIPKERYTFFVETEEDKAKTSARRRNPMEGSYPHGRTGRTVRDPLPGFCHFKYSKRGQPVVRMIRPGKYTPYHPTPDGDVATPYVEQGSKLTRGRSGKYRHIASYSLDELIALGWDGATYTSTKGKHAATGHAVPFIVGYDSDADDEYELIDLQAGKRAGIIGLPPDVVGCYMGIPDVRNPSQRQIVKIQNGR
jgi:hypothetical protein